MTEVDSIETGAAPGPDIHVRLDNFEGPLDLLLHLIKENRFDIFNIPIARITEEYLAHLEVLRELNLDIAGEFLVMAATLAHIKSQMLLPPESLQVDPLDEGADPRAELVRRLLEYQKYKDAADRLAARPLLHRDVFKRERAETPAAAAQEPSELVEVSLFKLLEAFHKALKNFHPDEPHEISGEQLRIADRVRFLINAIRSSEEGTVRFEDLFREQRTRYSVIVTFLAVLEMLKRGSLRLFQSEDFADIHLIGTPLLYGDWMYDGIDNYEGTPQVSS